MRFHIIMLTKTDYEDYYMRLRDLREDADLTQAEIAEYLHIKQNTYSQYENGHRQIPVDMIIKLSRYYKVSTDYILGVSDKK